MKKAFYIAEINLPLISSPQIGWIDGIGHHIIEYVELRLGGELFDRITGDVLDIYTELTTPLGHFTAYNSMIGKKGYYDNTEEGPLKLFVPLPFWFCNDVYSQK